MTDPLSADSPDPADTAAEAAGALSPDAAGAVDAVLDGITLSELVTRCPISRASVFELIKVMAIATTKGPAPGGRGRVAWLSAVEAERVRVAAIAVQRGDARIADFAQGLQRRPTRQTLPGSALTASAESADRVDAARLQARLRAAEMAISSGLGLTTAEAAWILGAKPAGAMVTRGRVVAIRAGFNCWTLSAESGDGVSSAAAAAFDPARPRPARDRPAVRRLGSPSAGRQPSPDHAMAPHPDSGA